MTSSERPSTGTLEASIPDLEVKPPTHFLFEVVAVWVMKWPIAWRTRVQASPSFLGHAMGPLQEAGWKWEGE